MSGRRLEGGGPWMLTDSVERSTLAAGDLLAFDLRNMTFRGRKGYFNQWLPLDGALVKNLDDSNAIVVEYNGQFPAYVEPNAKDAFDDVSIANITVENVGGTGIALDDLVVQAWVDSYGADEEARQNAERHPIERSVRSVLGL